MGLCAWRSDPLAESLPDGLMLMLLRVFCGMDLLLPKEAKILSGHLSDSSEPTFGVSETYALIAEVEELKGTLLNSVRDWSACIARARAGCDMQPARHRLNTVPCATDSATGYQCKFGTPQPET